jgi:hypothetical protein
MRTIEIQNCMDFKDSMFKVIVNGKEHVIRNQFLNVQVADDRPFDVKVKYSWGGSSVYTFHPKDNILLRISVNRRMMNWAWILLFICVMLAIILGYFLWANWFYPSFRVLF